MFACFEAGQHTDGHFFRRSTLTRTERHLCQTRTKSSTKKGPTGASWSRLSASRRFLPGARPFTCLVCLLMRSPAIQAGAMGSGLTDAAFSTLGSIYGENARGPITSLTLFAGFASTVCWPLSAYLIEHLGWRGACFIYAAIQIGVALPILLLALPRGFSIPTTYRRR